MSREIQIGETLTINPTFRLVYVGDGKAETQAFYPERSRTGGLTNSGNGEWKTYKAAQPLNEGQITRWLELNQK